VPESSPLVSAKATPATAQHQIPAVLVTRPQAQADGLCRQLEAAGYRPLRQPLLTIEPLPDAQPAHPLPHYQDVFFVSANAVRFGLRALSGEQFRWPVGTRCFAVGERTAAALRVCGIAVRVPGDDMRSEALLELPELHSVRGRRMLLVRGEGGRTLLHDTLRARGAELEELLCYRRTVAPLEPQRLRALLQREQVKVILISSGEAMAYLSRLLNPPENSNLASIGLTVIVPSQRVAALAQAAGWQHVRVARNASDEAMLDALQTMALRANPGE